MVEGPMNSARDAIIDRIRDAVGRDERCAADEYGAIERRYRRDTQLTQAERLELFASRIVHYDGSVQSCSRGDLPETLAAMLVARGKTRVHVPADIDRSWLPPQFEFVADRDASAAELDASEGVLTGCSVAIAMTGTIVLTHGPGEGRRVLTLVPDYHLVVVFVDQIVETVPEAIARVTGLSPALVTTISGPSATSDIEMTRIKGVHGPRTLDVVLVHRVNFCPPCSVLAPLRGG
jgi:L-lactate dehydrogenase complex protein LldG